MARYKNGINLRQQSLNKTDAAVVQTICDALSNVDANVMQDIIMQPHYISGLIIESDSNPHQIKCPYALHAIFYPLCTSNRSDILNKMSDNRIDILKKLIETAKKQPKPNKKLVELFIKNRITKTDELCGQDKLVNTAMLQSLRISEKVEDVWDDATQELDKWQIALNNFERIEMIPDSDVDIKESEPNKTFLTIPQLIAELGLKDQQAFYNQKYRILKKNPKRVNEINGWFVFGGFGQGKLFDAKHIQEYKQMAAQVSRQTNKKETLVPKNENNVKKDIVKNTVQKHPTNLLDIKMLEAYVEKLSELYNNAQTDLANAEAECAQATEKAITTTNARERADYLNRATSANEIVLKNQENVNDLSKQLADTKELLDTRQQAIDALHAADEKIAKFLEQHKIMSL